MQFVRALTFATIATVQLERILPMRDVVMVRVHVWKVCRDLSQ